MRQWSAIPQGEKKQSLFEDVLLICTIRSEVDLTEPLLQNNFRKEVIRF